MRDDYGQQDTMGSLLHLRRQRRSRRPSVNAERFSAWKNRLLALLVFLLLLGFAGIFAEL